MIEVLQKRIANLGAVHTGQFLVDCDTYHSTSPALASSPQGPKVLHVLHNSEQPATVFSVVESPPGANSSSNSSSAAAKSPVTFTSDTLFDLLLLKLGGVYAKKFKIESKGSRFEVGDFVVKLGLVSSGGSCRGILVEIEYAPCVVPQSCWGLLSEFARGFLGSVVQQQMPAYLQARGAEVYTPVDTVQQYLEHFNAFRFHTILKK